VQSKIKIGVIPKKKSAIITKIILISDQDSASKAQVSHRTPPTHKTCARVQKKNQCNPNKKISDHHKNHPNQRSKTIQPLSL